MAVDGIDLRRLEWRCFGIAFGLTWGGVVGDGLVEVVESVAVFSAFLHHFDIIIEHTHTFTSTVLQQKTALICPLPHTPTDRPYIMR
jgi:hypothetical protein